MRKIHLRSFFFILLLITLYFALPTGVFAAISATLDPQSPDINTPSINFTFKSNGGDFIKNGSYAIGFFKGNPPAEANSNTCSQAKFKDVNLRPNGDTIAYKLDLRGNTRDKGDWTYQIWLSDTRYFGDGASCGSYQKNRIIFTGTYTIFPPLTSIGKPGIISKNNCSIFMANTSQDFLVQNVLAGQPYKVGMEGSLSKMTFNENQISKSANGLPTAEINLSVGDVGNKKVCVTVGDNTECDYYSPLNIIANQPLSCGSATQNGTPGMPLYFPEEAPEAIAPPPPCLTLENGKCTEVKTAMGAIGTDPNKLTNTLFKLLLGFSGGVAILIIILSGYKLMASQGEAEKVKEARESLTSAIVGLLFIIFSFVILQIIGVDILHIPGFG